MAPPPEQISLRARPAAITFSRLRASWRQRALASQPRGLFCTLHFSAEERCDPLQSALGQRSPLEAQTALDDARGQVGRAAPKELGPWHCSPGKSLQRDLLGQKPGGEVEQLRTIGSYNGQKARFWPS